MFALVGPAQASSDPPFPITESFANATATGWTLGGSAALTAPGTDTAGSGWLRLTSATTNQAGYAFFDTPFPATKGAAVEFDYATYGGTGADGLTFFLYDGTTTAAAFQIGAFGGSLGYAPCSNGSKPGLKNAYTGVGFDEFGNFTNLTTSCGVPGGNTARPNYVSVRGSQAASYDLLSTAPTSQALTATRANARHVTISVLPNGKLNVFIKYPDGTFQHIVTDLQLPAAPSTLKLGFAGSTGGSTNIHEIHNTTVVKPTDITTTITDGGAGKPRGSANTWTAVVTNAGANDTNSGTFTATNGAQGLTGVTWTCAASAGSSCGAATSGSGFPNLTTGGLQPSGTLTFQITGTPAPNTDYAQMTADAQPTGDTGDTTPNNNAATDTSDLTPIFDAQPTFTLAPNGLAVATTTNARGGNMSYSNRWQRCDPDGSNCVDIAGATSTSYTTTAADRGFTIRFTRTATNAAGSTLSASAHYSPLPTTNLLSAPSGSTTTTSAAPTFSTPTSGATLECKLDAGAYAACTSPKSYTGLLDGSHTFSVRAVYGGLSDDTPATATWMVDTMAPNTSITSNPVANDSSTTADLGFTGTDPGGSGVASYECRIDSGAWGACTSLKNYTGLSQGNHTFDVRATDAAGNVDATPASYTWRVDTGNPNTTINTNPPSNSSSTTGPFTFSGTDVGGSGVASYECRIDSGSWAACTSPKSFTGLTDGSHTVDVRAIDQAGNKDATPATYTWTVDTAAPNTSITSNPPANDASTSATLGFTGTDGNGSGVASYECRLDSGAWAPCVSPKVYTGLSEGNHTFDVRAIDAAGNVDASPASYTWRVDTSAPNTTIDTSPDANSGSTTGDFTFSGTDPSGSGVASFECRLDSGAWAACTTPKSFTGLADGSHTVDVRAIDSAGNTDATPATYTWIVDTTDPTTSLNTTPLVNSPDADPTFTFTGGDGGSGVGSFECRLDGGAWTTCTSPKDFTGLADGPHTFDVRTIDQAGNPDGTPQSFSWTIDTTAPNTTIVTHPPTFDSSTSAAFTFTGTDGSGTGVATYECQLDGGAWNPCSSPKNFTGLADGPHTFGVRAIDAAGNTDATPDTFGWTVDTAAPNTSFTSTPSTVSGSTTGAFAFTGSDPGGSGIASYECRLDGGSWTTCTSPQSYFGLADGSHTVDARAIDNAGNVDPTPASYTWTVDTSGPNTTITAQPAPATSSTIADFSFTGDDGSGGSVASYECQLDGGAWTICTSPAHFTGLTEGPHNFKVRAIDAGSNSDTSPASYDWVVDTTAPTTTLTGMPAPVSALSNPSFTFTGADPGGTGVTSFQCRLDGGAWTTCSSPKNFTGLSDGSHTFDVRAVDAAGTPDATPETYTWTIDTTGPPVTPDAPAKPTADTTPTLTFHTESGATLEIKIDGVIVGTTTAGPDGVATFTPTAELADGSHQIVVVGIDPLGNRGPEASPVILKVAATPPPKPTIPASPAPISSDTSPVFTLDGADGSTFECQLDDGSWAPCPATPTFPNLPDGTHTLKVRELNEAGVPGAERDYTWTVDTTKPALPIYVVAPPVKTPENAARFDLNTEPATTLRCSVDGGAFVECTRGLDLSSLTEGGHTIRAIATDEAGNDSAVATYDWQIAKPLTTSQAALTARLATNTIIHANKRMTIVCRLSKGSTVQTCDGVAYARLKGKLVIVAAGKRTLTKTGSLSAGVRVKFNKVGLAALKRNPGGIKVSVRMTSNTREGRTLTTRVNTKVYPARKTAHPVLSPVDNASAFGPGGKLRNPIKKLAKNLGGAKSVLCIGHTDNTATVAEGLERAKAACSALQKLGLKAKYTTQSKGSTAPRATNKTAAGRALNRRVVLLVRFP